MPAQSLDFAQLRELLCKPPSARSWRTIWASMVRAHSANPDLVAEVWVPYLLNHTQHWRPGYRAVSVSQLRHQFLLGSSLLRCADMLILESDEDAALLLRSPAELGHVFGVQLRGRVHFTKEVVELLTTKVNNLASLELDHVAVGTLFTRLSERRAALAGLTRLRICSGALSDASLRTLVRSSAWPQLTSLEIPGNEVGFRGLDGLFEHRPSISKLDLSRNPIWNDGLALMFDDGPPSRLRTLLLRESYLDDEGADVLASATSLHQLEALDLSHNDISDEGARALAYSAHLGRLHTLEMRHNRLSEVGKRALRHSPYLSMLEHLDVRDNAAYHLPLPPAGVFEPGEDG